LYTGGCGRRFCFDGNKLTAYFLEAGHTRVIRRRLMPKFLIEREIPNAGALSPDQLQGISQKSCSVLRNLGPKIQWLHSYVTGDKIYCVYIADNEATIREHAKQGGFPANRISEIKTIIDPTTSEG
jgi:Protein of unknown function (DUF4242)